MNPHSSFSGYSSRRNHDHQRRRRIKSKETNRIDAVAEELQKMGAKIKATADGLIIHGPTPLHGAKVSSRGDHRIG